ncbi:MAG: transcription initiation protein [Bacteroidetes bacterium]|nr:transcription initiation protein [Bacteroidota bacterium]
MKEFLLIFRNASGQQSQMSPEQLQAMMKPWQDWMGGIAAQNKLVSPGNRLEADGRVVKPDNVVTNGPYVEIKEAVGGYIIIRAASLDEAAAISKGCPILTVGGTVEVRALVPMD